MSEDNQESKKQVADRMIESIFNSVDRLEQHQRVMEEGVESLPEFLSIPPDLYSQVIPAAQLKNLSLMITEFKITLAKVKSIILKEKYGQLTQKLNFIIDMHSKGFIEINGTRLELFSRRQSQKHQWLELGNLFHVLGSMLTSLRTELLESLRDILYAFSSTKSQNKPI